LRLCLIPFGINSLGISNSHHYQFSTCPAPATFRLLTFFEYFPNALRLLNDLYDALRLHTNFFTPSAKILGKERDGSRMVKHRNAPLTHYRRALASEQADD
jgi:hypothetical protein